MDRTEATIRKLLAALPAPGYDLGILTDAGMYRLESVPAPRLLHMLPFLKYRNANGAHIYIRPTGESPYTLLDDLIPATLNQLSAEGYSPAAVVETSPGSFQAWLRHAQPLSKELGTLAAKTLADEFGADRGAADWRRFGRAPGFTNRKPQHLSIQGLYPFARLTTYDGQAFALAEPFRLRLVALQQEAEQERAAARLRFASRPTHYARPRATMDGQPPQTWRSASPLALKVGPSLTSPPSSPAPTSLATATAPAKPPTSAVLLPKPCAGLLRLPFFPTLLLYGSTVRANARQGESLAVSPCTLIALLRPA
jgi:hypothetical protein